ncbi:MAG: MFS transporter, partial [Roseiarcus sp.]
MSKTREGLAPREGPADWYAELSSGGKRTFWACAFGWGLDGFDVQIYGLALAAIATTLALNSTQSGWIATATLFTSAFGGWIAGLLADRIGRVRMLQISVAW